MAYNSLAPITGIDMFPDAGNTEALRAADTFRSADAVANPPAQPPPPRGIGMASPPPPAPVVADPNVVPQTMPITPEALQPAPTDAPAAPQQPSQQESFYDFENRPIQSIGLALGQFAAGYRGEPGPLGDFNKQKLEQQAMQYKQAELGMNVIEKYAGILEKSPGADHAAIIGHAQEMFGKSTGFNAGPLLTAISDGRIKNFKQKFDAVIKSGLIDPKTVALYENDPIGLDKLVTAVAEHKATAETPEDAKALAKARAEGTDAGTPDKPRATEVVDQGGQLSLIYSDTGDTIKTFPKGTTAAEAAAGASQYNSEANNLRGEFTNNSKQFVVVRDSYSTMQDAAKNPSPAGDLSLIFGYMKILDPGSVVRDNEQATAANAPGVPNQIRQWYNEVLKGNVLLPERRKDIMGRAKGFYDVKDRLQKAHEDEYRRLATSRGIKPDDAVVNYRLPADGGGGQIPSFKTPEEVRAALAAGTLRKGDPFRNAAGEELTAQ